LIYNKYFFAVELGVQATLAEFWLTELDRIETLLALLAIAFCWAHLLEEWLHEQNRSQLRVITVRPSVFSGMIWTG